MKWNQKTIHQWGIDTFGAAALNTLGVAIRMSKETVELSNVLMTMDDVDKISMEAADVAIVLLQVANCIGFDAQEAEADEVFPGGFWVMIRIPPMDDHPVFRHKGLSCAEMGPTS